MSDQQDRRNAPRSPIQDTLFVESVSSSQVSVLEDAAANAVNASSSGLQVELDFPVLEEAEIALWINSDDGSRTLISGVIRWTQPTDHNTFLVGIELDEQSGPAINNWLKTLH